MVSRSTIAIIIGVVIAISVCAAVAVVLLSDSDNDKEKSFNLSYYDNGKLIKEDSYPKGSSVVLMEWSSDDEDKRFVGWNTARDGKGSSYQSGQKLTVNGNISLHTTFVSGGTYAIILEYDENKCTLSADPELVQSGGSSLVTYKLLPGNIEKDFIIAVNGSPMKLNSMNRILIENVTEDKIVTVSGVYDVREHNITIPSEQKGYVLTVSEERVHHGESYEISYKLLPGYKETADFGIQIGDGKPMKPVNGKITVNDVKGDHLITVLGVEAIKYEITAGKNTVLKVKGETATTATVEDLIMVVPVDGYDLPKTFNSNINGPIKSDGDGYRVTGNATFPSIVKVTIGKNVTINGGSATVIVCTTDKVTVSYSSGYGLPPDFIDKIKAKEGAKYSSGKFTFGSDIVIPSIYKVTYVVDQEAHETFFVTEGSIIPPSTTLPIKDGYEHTSWSVEGEIVSSNLTISPIWEPMQFTLTFGKNLKYSINGRFYAESKSYSVTIEDEITIEAIQGYELPTGYLPPTIFLKNENYFNVRSSYTLKDIHYVQYNDSVTKLSVKYYFAYGTSHTVVNPQSQPKPLFTFDLTETGYIIDDFIGWEIENEPPVGDVLVIYKNYTLYSCWREFEHS